MLIPIIVFMIGLAKSSVVLEVIACDYTDLKDPITTGLGWDYKDEIAKNRPAVNLEVCWDCAGLTTTVQKYSRFKLTQCCENPWVGRAVYKKYKEQISAKGASTENGLDDYPTPNCNYVPFTYEITCSSVEREIAEALTTICTDESCEISGQNCSEICGLDKISWNKVIPAWENVTCLVTSSGLACPEKSRSVIAGRDKWRNANVTDDYLSKSIKGLLYQDLFISELVRVIDDKVNFLSSAISRLTLEVSSNSNTISPGLINIDGKVLRAKCVAVDAQVTVVGGFWKSGGKFVNPYTREVFNECDQSWKGRPLSFPSKILTQALTEVFDNKRDFINPILQSTFGLTKVVSSLERLHFAPVRVRSNETSQAISTLSSSSSNSSAWILNLSIGLSILLGVVNLVWNITQQVQISL